MERFNINDILEPLRLINGAMAKNGSIPVQDANEEFVRSVEIQNHKPKTLHIDGPASSINPEDFSEPLKPTTRIGTSGAWGYRQMNTPLAWYISYHSDSRWGIFVRDEGIRHVAENHLQALSIPMEDKYLLAERFLYNHELFHYIVDRFITSLELLLNVPLYIPVMRGFPGSQWGREFLHLEEGLAEAYALNSSAIKVPGAKRCLNKMIESAPPGYCDGVKFAKENVFKDRISEISKLYLATGIILDRDLPEKYNLEDLSDISDLLMLALVNVGYRKSRSWHVNCNCISELSKLFLLPPSKIFKPDIPYYRVDKNKSARSVWDRAFSVFPGSAIIETQSFTDDLKSLPEKILKKWERQKQLITSDNFFSASLNPEKIKGVKKGTIWSFRVDLSYRAYAEPPPKDWRVFAINKHDYDSAINRHEKGI